MRLPKDTDHTIELPDIGTFIFGRETFADRAAIRARYLSIVKEYQDDDINLSIYAGMMAEYAELCVAAPPGWESLAEMEFSRPTEDKVFELFALLRAQQNGFRGSAAQGGQAQG